MIIGIGNDIVTIDRIATALDRHDTRFARRCFTPAENDAAAQRPISQRAAFYAKRFAAKEACVKALGTGFTKDILFQDMSITNDSAGRPSIALSGGAQRHLDTILPDDHIGVIHISLSDDPPVAQAFVVIEARPKPYTTP